MRSSDDRDRELYISPKELSARWRCSRSSVDRIARRAGLTRLCLGVGQNGIVRFVLKEIEAFETARAVRPGSGVGSM